MMTLRVNGQLQTFEPLADFRDRYGLPDTFGVNTFQPKDWAGLGEIAPAESGLPRLRQRVVEAVPQEVAATDWLVQVPELAAAFEQALHEANAHIGLKAEEIAFAVNGFGDVCSAYAFALARATMMGTEASPFDTVYTDWLYGTVSLGGTDYTYAYRGQTWHIRVVLHAYGRVGLRIENRDGVHFVMDKTLACPAEGFMYLLLREVGAQMLAATRE